MYYYIGSFTNDSSVNSSDGKLGRVPKLELFCTDFSKRKSNAAMQTLLPYIMNSRCAPAAFNLDLLVSVSLPMSVKIKLMKY